MSGTLTTQTAGRRVGFVLIGAMALAGCQDGRLDIPFLPEFGGRTAAPDTEAAAGPVEERDVEAPEVFSVTEQGLWDGRPSLGGVWVAHPDVTDPERVIIRNEATGAFVIGALFRRERDNPGPTLQVSSDAAEELGMLAGAPQTLSVVALRREAVPATPPIAAPNPDFVDAETVVPGAPADVSETTLDPLGAPSVDPAAPLGAPLDASVDPLTAAAAAIDAAEAEATPVAAPNEAAPLAAPIVEPAPVAAITPAASDLERPYIQVGIFSVEDNANDAAGRISTAGLPVNVLSQESQGRAFWRVIVGPASSEAARTSVMEQVQGLGFADAYFVTN